MEDYEYQKIPFFKRLKWAIINPENYEYFVLENIKKSFGYLVKLIILFSFIISAALAIKLETSYEETIDNFENTVKSIDNNEIQISEDTLKQIKELPKHEVCIAFFFISELYLFAVYLISTILDILLLSVLSWFTSRILKVTLKYTSIINISTYALTLSILLNAIYVTVNIFVNFEIKYFQIMYNAISYIYVITAILMIKSEMIKQQIELEKLSEEQKKVKEEIEEKEKQEKKEQEEQKEKDDNKKDNEEKRKSGSKKEKNDGETPEGSSAIV